MATNNGEVQQQGTPSVVQNDMNVNGLVGLVDNVHNVQVKLADQQADVNSPLYSVTSFEELGLKESLLKGIYTMKFVQPSKVQEKALPLLLQDPPQNMIAQSQSGTGKTAAFVLNMLSRVDEKLDQPQAICLAYSRELARQIMSVVQIMGQFTNCTTSLALKEPSGQRHGQITGQIVVGTPGTIIDLARKRLLNMQHVKIFVLDEADHMLDQQGLADQSVRVKKLCPPSAQFVLFSATFRPDILEFGYRIVPNANVIMLKKEDMSVDSIRQFYMDCQSIEHKFDVLGAIYGLMTMGQSIIFVNTRVMGERIQEFMTREGHLTSLLHGGHEPEQRDQVIDAFRRGMTKVLIATNVLARGIDILQVSLVINFDLPVNADREPDPETYLHRIGRTGRFGRSGVSINFVHDQQSLRHMFIIQKYYGKEMQRVPTDDLEALGEQLEGIQTHVGASGAKGA